MNVKEALITARVSLTCKEMEVVGYRKDFLDFFEECLTEYPYTEIGGSPV